MFVFQDVGRTSGGVVGGEAQAAAARVWAAAQTLSGQRENAEGSGGSEEGSDASYTDFHFNRKHVCF